MSTSITKQGILRAPTASSGYGRSIRYLRDTTSGSTANTSNHWCEIQAYDSNGVNVAQGKTVDFNGTEYANSVVTDGIINASYLPSGVSGTVTATIDLGAVTNITRIKIWHYYPDGRTYYDNITEVSEDGTNWDVVYTGQKPETEGGNEIFLYPKVTDGNTNENILVHTLPYAGDGDIENSKRSFSTDGWFTPATNTNNVTHYIAWGLVDSSFVSGAKFTLSFDIEFSGVTSGTGGTFRIFSQECYNTSVQTSAEKTGTGCVGTNSAWNADKFAYSLIDLKTAPSDGIYHYCKTGTLAADRTGNVSVNISIRTDYIGSGKYRVKNLKLEKGSIATPWTPSPVDDIYVGDHGFFEGSDKGSIGKGYMEGNEFYEL